MNVREPHDVLPGDRAVRTGKPASRFIVPQPHELLDDLALGIRAGRGMVSVCCEYRGTRKTHAKQPPQASTATEM